MKRRTDLAQPRQTARFDMSYRPYGSDTFGSFAEGIANFLGTARYLVYQTVFCSMWIIHNSFAPRDLQWDPWDRGLVLLTLILSLQASYAAPLILLAQSRQERRDRVQSENDRTVAERTQNDTEFLAREIAGVRLALADVVTNEELSGQLDDLAKSLKKLNKKVDALVGTRPEP
ncbi:MAG TPA: DUF1003 domain-containing protein [Ilumatobacter sp.]|nr:DUF1003 domain-containing protein [Ilumatobacter sp.]